MSAETTNGATIIDVKQQTDETKKHNVVEIQQQTDMSKSTLSDSEEFWKNFAENLYSTEKLPISNDLLHSLLSKIENCSQHILEHDLDYEAFYTALISFTCLQLIDVIDSYKIEQIIDLESVCSILIKYLLNYFPKKQRSTSMEDFEPILTSAQVLSIIDTLLNGFPLKTKSTSTNNEKNQSQEDFEFNSQVDLNTLIAILNSSKVPKLHVNKPSLSTESEQVSYASTSTSASSLSTVKTNENIIKSSNNQLNKDLLNAQMNNLMNSFLSQNFFNRKNDDQTVVGPSISINTISTNISSNSINKQETSVELVESKHCLDDNHSDKSSKELMTYFFRKHFSLNDGFKIIVDECNSNLTYLNVYKKNHLKQLLNELQPVKTNKNNQTPINTLEEAQQAKANCPNLKNDFNFMLKFLNIFNNLLLISDSTPSFETTLNKNNDVTINFDDQSLDHLTNLVLASQIAAITTCSSELIIKQNETKSIDTSTENLLNNDSNQVTELGIKILEKYLSLIYYIDTKMNYTNLYRNLNVKCVYVMIVHLSKLLHTYEEIKSVSITAASWELELFCSQLIKMLKIIFLDKQIPSESNQISTSFKEFDIKLLYTNVELFNLLNSCNTHKLFTLLFNLFKIFYAKCSSVYSTSKTTSNSTNKIDAHTKSLGQKLEFQTEIKNIDDPSSDEEENINVSMKDNITTTAKSIDNLAGDEDSEDFLLIGSWFDDQLAANTGANASSTTETVNATNANNLTVIEVKSSLDANFSTSAVNDHDQSLMEKENLCSCVDLMQELLDLIKYLALTEEKPSNNIEQALKESFNNEQVKQICLIIFELEKKFENFFSEKFIFSFYRFVEFLIVKHILEDDKQDILIDFLNENSANFENNLQYKDTKSDQILFMNKRYLSTLCQIFVFRLKNNAILEKTQGQIIKMWDMFLKLVEVNIEKCLNEPYLSEDVTVEHLSFLLFLFHHLPTVQRKSLQIELCQSLIRIETKIRNKLSTYSPLLISRLLVMLDYILHQFEEPSIILLQIIEKNLLNINLKLPLNENFKNKKLTVSNSSTNSNVEFSNDLNKQNEIFYPAIELIENFYLNFKNFKSHGIKTKKITKKFNDTIEPCFFSLTSTNINIFISGTREVSKLALEAFNENIDYDLFYMSLFSFIKLSSDVISNTKLFSQATTNGTDEISSFSFSNKEYVSILYNFSICWSLINPYNEPITTTNDAHLSYGTLPVSKLFLNRILNENYDIFSDTNDKLPLIESTEKNHEFIHLLRVGINFIGKPLKDLNAKLSYNLIFKDSNLNVTCDFFTKYWSKRFQKSLESMLTTAGSDYGLYYKENDFKHLNELFSNINPLNYHINIIERFLSKSKSELINQENLSSFLDLIVKLVNLYKYYYKRFVLLNDYFKNKSKKYENPEIIMLVLNASSLLKSTNTSTVATKQIDPADSHQAAWKFLFNLKQIDTSDSPLLLNEKYLFQELKSYLNNKNSQKYNLVESFQMRDDSIENSHLFMHVFYRWFNLESSFNLILNDLTSLLISLLNYLELNETSCETNQKLLKRCEFLFVDLNGDQNCFSFLSKNIINFFKSPVFIKHIIQLKTDELIDLNTNLKNKYEFYLFNKISSFTYEVIYKLTTTYFLIDVDTHETEDDFFLCEILEHVEQSLDSAYGLQGFCDFFIENDNNPPNNKLTTIFKSNRFLLFLSTSAQKSASKKYLLKIFSILNKLFKIHFQLSESKSSLVDKNLKTYTNLTTILSQLNQLASLDSEFFQIWLSKLSSIKKTENIDEESTNNDRFIASYTLKQLAIFLVQDNENSLNELVPLSFLNTLIQIGTNLINLNEGKSFPQLLSLMDLLASAGSGRGHIYLFQAACIWIEHLTSVGLEKIINSPNETTTESSNKDLLQSTTYVLSYVCDILNVLRLNIQKSNEQQQFYFDPSLSEEANKIVQTQIILDFNKDTEKVFEYIQQKLEVSLAKEKSQVANKANEKKRSAVSLNKKKNKSSGNSAQQTSDNGSVNFLDGDNFLDNEELDEEDEEVEFEEEIDEDNNEEESHFEDEEGNENENFYTEEPEDNYEEEDDNGFLFENEEDHPDDFHLKLDEEETENRDNNNDYDDQNDNDEDDEDEDDEDDDEDDDDDDDNTYRDFDEKSSYASASSTGNVSYAASSKKNNKSFNNQSSNGNLGTTITTTNSNPSLNNLPIERQDQSYHEYYEEDDEDFEESLSSQVTNNATNDNTRAQLPAPTSAVNQTSSNSTNLASINNNLANNLNRIDMNELFDAYGEDEAAAMAYVEHRSEVQQRRAVDNDEDDEEEDLDDDEEEYGDDFNENFVVGYEHVVDQQIAAAASAASSISNQNGNLQPSVQLGTDVANNNSTTGSTMPNFNLANVAATGREAIYQDLMSTITAAAAAISGRIQTQLSSSESTTNTVVNNVGTIKTLSKPALSASNTDTSSGTTNLSESLKITSSNKNKNDNTDEDLNSKLCTFTVTKKDFKNQHWYYCHTCKMIDRIGMCTICAKVCHKDHDVSYAKYGSFFCDCGAKEDGSCLALTKRTGPVNNNNNASSEASSKKSVDKDIKKINIKKISIQKKKTKSNSLSSGTKLGIENQIKLTNDSKDKDIEFLNSLSKQSTVELLRKLLQQIRVNKAKQLEKQRNQLIDCIKNKALFKTIRQILELTLIPLAKKTYDNSLINTNSSLARCELAKLKHQKLNLPTFAQLDKIDNNKSKDEIEKDNNKQLSTFSIRPSNIEQQPLFIVTLGSQEGAFENVRMTYTGEHGQQIKQLIQTHMLRRVSMCCLATKRRKHLIVTHEKGKSSHFTILQLNALLKQDSNKRNKLTLTKLNTIPVPFTLISVVANQYNEDYIALTGLKDCYVMYLNENGQTRQEIQQNQVQATTPSTTNTTTSAVGTTATSIAPTPTSSSTNEPKPSQQFDPTIGPNSSGLIILHPSLESSNFIIKAIWLPGSQTELALVTSEFIKVYDLSIDKISPIYCFLLPMGKIKDATFVYNIPNIQKKVSSDSILNEEINSYKLVKYIIIISSCGYLYYEEMNDVTSAKNGVYYITNTIEFDYVEENPTPTSTDASKIAPPPPPPPPATSSSTGHNSTTTSGVTTATSQFGSGVSVYYSFKLQLLFWSYQQGKSFMGAFKPNTLVLDKVAQISITNTKSSSLSAPSIQALCNWSEIPSHPGLLMAMTLLSNNPVILMFLPDKIYFQEIKLTNNQGGPSKAKIQDMVATRHPSSNAHGSSSTATISSANNDDDECLDSNENLTKKENFTGLPSLNSEKTTMILLCDDGSLKIYVADSEKTEYWLKPHLQPTNPISQLKSPIIWSSNSLFQLSPSTIQSKKFKTNVIINNNIPTTTTTNAEPSMPKPQNSIAETEPKVSKTTQLKRTNATKSRSSSIPKANQQVQVHFPIDYFEKCTQIADIEYGGDDLLEIYNTQQLKSRLGLGGNKFIVSMRSQGIKLEISNTSDAARTLLMGCRILVGTHSVERAPSYFEVFNRRIPVKLTRSRWFDICLTREEAIIADNKLTVFISSSTDSRYITIIDACVCYGKSKEQLNWNKAEAQVLQKRYNQTKSAQTDATKQTNSIKTGKQSSDVITELKQKSDKKSSSSISFDKQDTTNILYEYEPKPFDCLLGQTLDVFENCLVLMNSSNTSISNQNSELVSADTLKNSHLISIELLSLICPPLVVFKANSLLYNSLYLPSVSLYSSNNSIVSLYNNYKDDAILSLISNTFKIKMIQNSIEYRNYFNTFEDYLDQVYDFETFQKILLICKSLIQQHRANNLVKFLNDKFNIATNGQRHFISSLNSLFWRIVNRSPFNNNSLNSIGQPSILAHLNLTIEPLIEIMHAFLLVEFTTCQSNCTPTNLAESFSSSATVNLIIDCYLRLLCSNYLDINFASRQVLLQLVKPPKKSSSSNSTITTVTTNSNISTSQPKSSSSTQSNTNSKTSKSSNLPLPPLPPPPATSSSIQQPASHSLTISEIPNETSIDEAIRFSSLNSNQNVNVNDYMVRINDLVENDETNEEGSSGQASSNAYLTANNLSEAIEAIFNNPPPVTAGTGISVNASQQSNNNPNQYFGLAPFVFNEEDEMLQLAMALGLNEQQQANHQPATAEQPTTSQQTPQVSSFSLQPPATLPRSLVSNEVNANQKSLSRQSSNEATNISSLSKPSASSRTSKRKQVTPSTPSTTQLETDDSSTLLKSAASSNPNLNTFRTASDTIHSNQVPTPQYLLNSSLKLFHLRKTLLEKFSHRIETPTFEYYLNEAENNNVSTNHPTSNSKNCGLKSIAFFQCILTLMADLNPKEDSDKKLLDSILHSLLNILKPLKTISNSVADLNESFEKLNIKKDIIPIYTRTPQNEIILICLRTISILLSKSKYQRSGDNCNFIIHTLLNHLCQFNLIDVCLNLMKFLYFDYWKPLSSNNGVDSELDLTAGIPNQSANNSGGLMKLSYESRYYDDLSPYFVRDPLNKDSFVIPPLNLSLGNSTNSNNNDQASNQQQIKTTTTSTISTTTTTTASTTTTPNAIDLFDNYTELLTEILIRLPYQMKKLCLGSSNSSTLASATTASMMNNSMNNNSSGVTSDLISLNSIQHHLNLSQITNMFEFSSWTHYLCEYLVLPQCYYLKRLIKKLLQILCGSKDKYRKFKDQHILTTSIRQLTNLCHLNSSPNPISMLGLGATVAQASEALSAMNLGTNNSSGVPNSLQVGTKSTTCSAASPFLSPPKLTYLNLLKITEHLKTMLEVAVSRTSNWQRFCIQNPSTVLYLIELALLMGVDSNGSGIDSSSINTSGNIASASTSVIVPNITQLLLCALGGTKSSSSSSSQSKANQQQQQANLSSRSSSQTQLTLLNNTGKLQSGKSASTKTSSALPASNLILSDENLSSILVNSLFKLVNKEILIKFIRTYFLEAAQANIRWSLHSLLYNVYRNSIGPNQDQLYDILIQMWPNAIISFGSKASQYVDLIGYIIIKSSASQSQTQYENPRVKDFLQRVIELYQYQNILLATHPNSSFYNTLSNLIGDFDGFYLEADPCFICNNIETPVINLKLNSIKADAKFTTNQQIFKLVSAHSISKILVKISEIRKSKMVSAINIYYTSKSVQSIVDLKMNNKLWTKAKRICVQPAQQEIKIEFQLPIIACNLIIEYSDFYDRDTQANAETAMLQCPRCSASVPANPGVCNTCGENVFQCHKCRSINYDERDPFLCNSCGFCKFAKFEFTIVGKPCCAIDPIESEDDRKQTLQNISSLLDRADKIYFALSQHTRPALEALIIKNNEQNLLEKFVSYSGNSAVNSNLNGSDSQQINYNQLISNFNAQPNVNGTGVIGVRLTPLTVINTNGTVTNSQHQSNSKIPVSGTTTTSFASSSTTTSIPVTGNLYINKTVQSIIQKYTIECKNKFDELSKIILKLNLCRKELREYDKQFKSTNNNNNLLTNSNSSASASVSVTRKNSTAYGPIGGISDINSNTISTATQINRLQSQLFSLTSSSYLLCKANQPKNNCFGCASASIDNCITLFRALLCANNLANTNSNNNTSSILLLNYVKTELCRQGVLEELIYFSLKRNNNLLNGSQINTMITPTQQSVQPTQTVSNATTNVINNNVTSAQTQPNVINPPQQQIHQRLFDHDIINLIYLLIKDNPDGSLRFQSLIIEKIDMFLAPISTVNSDTIVSSLSQLSINNVANSPLRNEMMLLSSLMTKQEDSCWEMMLRLVIHILLRSLNVVTVSNSKQHQQRLINPVVIECLTLPCLRILNHVCKTTTNMSLLTQLATGSSTNFNKNTSSSSSSNKPPVLPVRQSLFTASGASNSNVNPIANITSMSGLNRYNSEPAEANYLQLQSFSQINMLNNNYLPNLPQPNEIDPNEFLQTKYPASYYEKWLQMNKQSSKSGGKQSFDDSTVNQAELTKIKLKYFAAWRKYTLKKRKQQQLGQTLSTPSVKTAETPKTNPLPQITSDLSSNATTIDSEKVNSNQQPISSVSNQPLNLAYLNNLNDYELKSKWLKNCLFCVSSKSVRQLTCNIIQSIFLFYSSQNSTTQTTEFAEANSARKFQLAELLCQFLEECGSAGESFGEYLNLFKLVINDKDCKYRLVLKCGILNKIETLLHREIKYLSDLERLSESSSSTLSSLNFGERFSLPISLSTNLTLGYSVKCLTEILAIFLKENNIKNKFKGHLIATVLNSYLSLKKLVFQRTKLIEEAQEKLLNTLEQMTSGTEIETRKFMSICIDTVNNFDLDDLVTPVFIFERLCNIIYPEEIVDNKEFSLILEKDPNQEDYLQGRMLGNPYSSNEPGLGPLMRNVKNRICTDCELVALLEDDNGMELLVNNKIISLDLTVRDVYKKVWLSEVLSEHEPMRVVYRMTGLSGDATEDIIDNLDGKGNDSTKNEEEVYRMAEELAHNGALPVMLERLSSITQQNFTFGKPLLSVLLKLFDYALKLAINRTEIIQPEMKAITTMLQTLNMMLKIEQVEPNKIGVHLAEQLLNIMELILSEASKQPADIYNEFSSLCGDTEQLEFLLNNINGTFVRSHPNLLQALMRLIPFLSFGDEKKMKSLIAYFSTYFSNFEEFDKITLVPNSTNEDMLHLECFCVIVNGIEIGEMGKRLRDMMRDGGVSQKSIEYLMKSSPKVTTYLNSDFELWKDFISRNSLPYVLRILTGLCRSHESIQDLIGESCIPLLHKLEQFSSGNLVGILAEDLLLALKQNISSKVSTAIEEVRNQTKAEKKKLAMAMRQKQLNQLGMKTNDKGQLIATDPSTLKNITDEVGEEKGHICCICREGYKYHPQKVLAIYTFTKKVDLEPVFEAKTRKTVGYSTVTHFNLVHIDCHTNAIRSARTCRDEWENAALQNANTKCNGILPIWGPDVTETLFSNALARHNNYLLEATGIRDSSYILSIHDLKLMLNKFSENLSFSEDSGGGGRESNINLIPYMIHAILYSINTAKYVSREEKNLKNFLEQSEKLVSNSFECENVFYFLAMSLIIMQPADWIANKTKFLQRLLLTVHTRLVNIPSLDKQKLLSTTIQEFKKYKPSLLFIGLINLLFKHIHQKVPFSTEDASQQHIWTEKFGNYIRHNDIALMESCRKALKEFEEDLIVCEEWMEMFDVLGFLEEISEPVEFLKNYLVTFSK